MKIFAISDLHLAGNDIKPMDVFGAHWQDHWQRIQNDWQQQVSEEDTVLIAGDISWAMHLEDAMDDLRQIGELPGRKILLKGNHDFWWDALSKVRRALPGSMQVVQNDSIRCGDMVIAGSRGWQCPGSGGFGGDDEKIYRREAQRMQLSLKSAEPALREGAKLIGMMHYPPCTEKCEETEFTRLWEEYGAHTVVYGHLHNVPPTATVVSGMVRGVEYVLTSCDYIGFKLKRIL